MVASTDPELNPQAFTSALLASAGNDSCELLQMLHALQLQFNHIPQASISQLSEALSLSETYIRSVIGFYTFLHETPRGEYDILFSDSITDHMLGSRLLLSDLCDKLGVERGVPRKDGRVTVDTTSCTGLCDQGPAILVNGRVLTRLDAHKIQNIALLIENCTPLDEWPSDFFRIENNIRQSNLLLSHNQCNGEAVQKCIDNGADKLLEEIDDSGLRGRGGAGFKTALKWKFCKEAHNGGTNDRVVVCNADEGEPGTFKDRVLLDSQADNVFEGMTLCAGIIGARQGFLYLRGEYLYLKPQLEAVLAKRRDKGLLGKNILGKHGFDFDIEIHMGAGAYICGEESSLIESLEGKRGVPRKRPPFPVTHGYLQKPTVVNNVETYLAAACIAASGSEWFRSVGTEESSGTKLLSICGDCEHPGIYEVPFGTSIQQILDACGASDVQAVQVAGAAGMTIPPEEFERSIAFEDVPTAGSFMVFNNERNLLDMVQNFAHFFVHESCGFCTPCRVGGALMKDLVDKLTDGKAGRYDTDEMRNIGLLMKSTSHCGLGTTAPNCVLDMLDKFPYIVEEKLAHHASYEPAFDLDEALQEARDISHRNDSRAHIRTDT